MLNLTTAPCINLKDNIIFKIVGFVPSGGDRTDESHYYKLNRQEDFRLYSKKHCFQQSRFSQQWGNLDQL